MSTAVLSQVSTSVFKTAMTRSERKAKTEYALRILRSTRGANARHPLAEDGNGHDWQRASHRIGNHYVQHGRLFYCP